VLPRVHDPDARVHDPDARVHDPDARVHDPDGINRGDEQPDRMSRPAAACASVW